MSLKYEPASEPQVVGNMSLQHVSACMWTLAQLGTHSTLNRLFFFITLKPRVE